MEDKDNKLAFFSDFKEKVFLGLSGIVSLSTFIPAFLNKTSVLFGLKQIKYGYDLFVAIYFILPYLFYSLYCSINDNSCYFELLPEPTLIRLKKKRFLKTAIALSILIAVLIYLIFPIFIYDIFFSCLLSFVAILLFCSFIIKYLPLADYKNLVKEFLIIGVTILLVSGLFFFNQLIKSNKYKEGKYSTQKQDSAFNSYEANDSLKIVLVDLADSVRKVSNSYYIKANLLGGIYYSINEEKINNCKSTIIDLNKHFNILNENEQLVTDIIKREVKYIRYDAKVLLDEAKSILEKKIKSKKDTAELEEVYEIDHYCKLYYDYAVSIQKSKLITFTKQWASLLQNLQFKSLLWFFFLMMVGLSYWFKLQTKLAGLSNPSNTDIPLLKSSIGEVKSFIFLIFVLMIPWFKTIDEKDIELNKPFLNLKLNNLLDGEINETKRNDTSISKITGTYNLYNSTINNQMPDTTIHDPLLDKIDKNVTKANQLILEHGKRTIGSLRDLKSFVDTSKK